MKNKLRFLMRKHHLSESAIFDDQIVGRKKERIEHLYSVMFFVEESKKFKFKRFKMKNKLTSTQTWKHEYTLELKKRIMEKNYGI